MEGMAVTTFESRFFISQQVTIDDDTSVVGTVTGMCFKSHIGLVQVSWIHNGQLQEPYIEEWRLSPWKK